ncbi:hypothetical protein [Thalassobacillus hwangdonensis]|uniref:ABC transporter permease n=1 Tax=Thalassobacillus hwangdonensis TaxID=546108 RepID=A0ABW3L1Y7_9BACI
MFNDLKAMLYFLTTDFRFGLTIFWSIFLASTGVLYLLTFSFNDVTIIVSSSLAIYIYCGISGFLMTKETLPFCLKMGTTRNRYFSGVIVFNLILGAFMAFISSTLSLVVGMTEQSNLQLMTAIDATSLSPGWFNQFWLETLICFLFLSIGFMFSAIFYRTGLVGGLSVIGIVVIAILLPDLREQFLDFFLEFSESGITIHYVSLFIAALLAMIPTWLLLNRASIHSAATR